jgi:threonyl-tRNA synthetase
MVHRAIFGSIERFFFWHRLRTASVIFHLGWHRPSSKLCQLRTLCKTTTLSPSRLPKKGIRVVDRGNERLAKQTVTRTTTPVMAVVGMKEMEPNFAVRAVESFSDPDLGVEDLIAELSRCSDIAEEMSLIGEKGG